MAGAELVSCRFIAAGLILPATMRGKNVMGTVADRGRRWTLVVAVLVFLWILFTISSYVFSRLSGEHVSGDAPLEIRMVLPEPVGGVLLKGYDGETVSLAETVLLTARDFSTFRGTAAGDGQYELSLHFSSTGRKKLGVLQALPEETRLAIVVNSRVIGQCGRGQLIENGLTIPLAGLTSSDANEVFARLTQ